jgi:predicted acyl esterase
VPGSTIRDGHRVKGVAASWAEVALGITGFTVVVGMRAYAVVTAGLRPIDWIAIPALLASLALVAVATVRLLGPVRRWRRLVAVPVGALLMYYLVMPVAVGLMLTHVPPIPVGSRTPADLGLAYRDVWFRTPDGVSLSGWYLPSRNGAAVAMLHGAGSTRSAVLDHAVLLNRAGYGTLLFDSRGFGRSGGVGMTGGWWGDLDLAGAVDFLVDRPEVDPARIGVFGLSMGGEEAISAAAHDARIRAVVAEGAGAIRTVEDTRSIPGWTRYLGIPHYWVQTQTIELFTDAPRPIALEDAMREVAPRPVLLISAGAAELAYTREYRAAAPTSTELWALDDTPHTAALSVHPTEYRRRVLAFLNRSLAAW